MHTDSQSSAPLRGNWFLCLRGNDQISCWRLAPCTLAAVSVVLFSKLFTFVVFPMVNPDGVIHGGSRTNAMGYDLNRNWGPNPPSVVVETAHIWTYLLEIFNSRNDFQAVWAIDLHAHSK